MKLKYGDDVRPVGVLAEERFSAGVVLVPRFTLPSGKTASLVQASGGERIVLKRTQIEFPI